MINILVIEIMIRKKYVKISWFDLITDIGMYQFIEGDMRGAVYITQKCSNTINKNVNPLDEKNDLNLLYVKM